MNTLTIEVATLMRKGFLIPELWKKVVPSMNNDQEVYSYDALQRPRLTVEDEVDTGELLPRLDEDAGEGTEEDLVVREPEAVDIRALAELLLFDQGSADVVQLSLDLGIVGVEGGETGKGLGGRLVLALLD